MFNRKRQTPNFFTYLTNTVWCIREVFFLIWAPVSIWYINQFAEKASVIETSSVLGASVLCTMTVLSTVINYYLLFRTFSSYSNIFSFETFPDVLNFIKYVQHYRDMYDSSWLGIYCPFLKNANSHAGPN